MWFSGVWAVGGEVSIPQQKLLTRTYCFVIFHVQEFIYPQDVAYPIGGEGTPRYVVLEVHYNNPAEVSGEL